jgi:hypothetical protein
MIKGGRDQCRGTGKGEIALDMSEILIYVHISMKNITERPQQQQRG